MLNHLKTFLKRNPPLMIVEVIREGPDRIEFVFSNGISQCVFGKKMIPKAVDVLKPLMNADTKQTAKW